MRDPNVSYRPARILLLAGIACMICGVGVVEAHVPITPGETGGLEDAVRIPDPGKSWAVYAGLSREDVDYYVFNASQDEAITVMSFVPPASPEFSPWLALIGPDLNADATPESIEAPPDVGVIVVDGTPGEPVYESFGPSAFYPVGDLQVMAPETGTYYLAMYDDGDGRYGLAIGTREEFTSVEFLRVPLDRVQIYQWEGQSLALIFAPMLAIILLGTGILASRGGPRSPAAWIGVLAGLSLVRRHDTCADGVLPIHSADAQLAVHEQGDRRDQYEQEGRDE